MTDSNRDRMNAKYGGDYLNMLKADDLPDKHDLMCGFIYAANDLLFERSRCARWRGLAIMLAIMALLYLSVTMGWMR